MLAAIDKTKIHQGPGNIWLGCALPATGSRLVLDVNGTPVATGVVPAPASPALSSVSGGTLAATDYFVVITLLTASGETTPSPEVSLNVALNNELVIQSPPPTPGALGWNAYVSSATGTEKLQNTATIPIGSNWTQTFALTTTGAAAPLQNTTTALYGGAIKGATTITMNNKVHETDADQVMAPIDVHFVGEDDSIEAEFLETDLAKLKNFITNGVYSTGIDTNQPIGFQNYEEISFGGMFVVPQYPIALISPRVDYPGKFVVTQLYQAYVAKQPSLAFSKESETVAKVTLKGLAIPSRPNGDQVGKIWRQL